MPYRGAERARLRLASSGQADRESRIAVEHVLEVELALSVTRDEELSHSRTDRYSSARVIPTVS